MIRTCMYRLMSTFIGIFSLDKFLCTYYCESVSVCFIFEVKKFSNKDWRKPLTSLHRSSFLCCILPILLACKGKRVMTSRVRPQNWKSFSLFCPLSDHWLHPFFWWSAIDFISHKPHVSSKKSPNKTHFFIWRGEREREYVKWVSRVSSCANPNNSWLFVSPRS